MNLLTILHKRKNSILILTLIMSLLLVSCGNHTSLQSQTKETGFIPAKAGMYDCADTAVVVTKDTKEKTITFYNLIMERNYTLSFDGTSKLADKYGTSMSMEQIKDGDIVDITFLKSKKLLNSLTLSNQSWTLNEVSKFEIAPEKKEIKIADNIYNYSDHILICTGQEDAQIMDINQCDRLNIQGIGHTIYSISIDKGHGYLRLKNDEYFLDGWIEVGQEIIRTISEDMLLVVPEGTYDVLISAQGISGTKKVTIKRNEETELDIGDLKGEEIKKFGTLIFSVTPDTALVYIDGEEVDISEPVKLEYGIHQMMAKADSYQTVTQYIKVGQENATIQVTLEKQNTKEENTVSSNDTRNTGSVSSNTTPTPTTKVTPTPSVSSNTTASTSGYKVTIDAPAGVEVYIDGNYVGISPISFLKVEGIHVVTLRKTGYSTRSYTINVDSEKKDASFSFSDLTIID